MERLTPIQITNSVTRIAILSYLYVTFFAITQYYSIKYDIVRPYRVIQWADDIESTSTYTLIQFISVHTVALVVCCLLLHYVRAPSLRFTFEKNTKTVRIVVISLLIIALLMKFVSVFILGATAGNVNPLFKLFFLAGTMFSFQFYITYVLVDNIPTLTKALSFTIIIALTIAGGMKGALLWLFIFYLLSKILFERAKIASLLDYRYIASFIFMIVAFPIIFISVSVVRDAGQIDILEIIENMRSASNALGNFINYIWYRLISRISILERYYIITSTDSDYLRNLLAFLQTTVWDFVPSFMEFGDYAGFIYNRLIAVWYFNVDLRNKTSFSGGLIALYYTLCSNLLLSSLLSGVSQAALLWIVKCFINGGIFSRMLCIYVAYASFTVLQSGNFLELTQTFKTITLSLITMYILFKILNHRSI